MAYIEGVGDEVVLTLALFIILAVVFLVWLSTSVNERANRNVIVIERARFEQLLRRLGVYHRARDAHRASQERAGQSASAQSINSSAQNADSSRSGARPAERRDEGQGEGSQAQNPQMSPQNGAELLQTSAELLQTSAELPQYGRAMQADAQRGTDRARQVPENDTKVPENDTKVSKRDTQSTDVCQSGEGACSVKSDLSSHGATNQSQDSFDHVTSQSDVTEAKEGDIDTMRKLRVAFLQRQSLPHNDVTQRESDVINHTRANDDISVTQACDNYSANVPNKDSHMRRHESDTMAHTQSANEIVAPKSSSQSNGGDAQAQLGANQNTAPAQTSAPDSTQRAGSAQTGARAGEDRLEGHIRVKLKYMNERQTIVQAKPDDTLQHFKRTHFASELAENLRVRLIYNGQELRNDTRSLTSYNILDNSVVHCLLSNVPGPPPGEPVNEPEREFDLGHLVFPLFGFMLALVWYCRVEYKQYFNAMSTLSLMAITFLYVVAFMASYRRQNDVMHEHQD